MIIIAVDPGLVTGVARYNTKLNAVPASAEIPYSGIGSALEHMISGNQRPRGNLTVICEKYVMMPGPKTAQPEALMIMGVTEFLCQKYDVKLVWQFPRDAEKMCPDSFLRQVGWYLKTKDGHANAAMRHIGMWLAHNEPERFAEMIGI